MPYTATFTHPFWDDTLGSGVIFESSPLYDPFPWGLIWNPMQPDYFYQLCKDVAATKGAIVKFDRVTKAFVAGGIVDTKDVGPNGYPAPYDTWAAEVSCGGLCMAQESAKLFFFTDGGYSFIIDAAQTYWKSHAQFVQVDPVTLAVVQSSPTPSSVPIVSGPWNYPLGGGSKTSASKTGQFVFVIYDHAYTAPSGNPTGVPYALWDSVGNHIHFGKLGEFVTFPTDYGQNYNALSTWDNSDRLWVLLRSASDGSTSHLLVLQAAVAGGAVSFSLVANYTPGGLDPLFVFGLNYKPNTDEIVLWFGRNSDPYGYARIARIDPATGVIVGGSEITAQYAGEQGALAYLGIWSNDPINADAGDFPGPTTVSILDGVHDIFPFGEWSPGVPDEKLHQNITLAYDTTNNNFWGLTYDSAVSTHLFLSIFSPGDPPVDCATFLGLPFQDQALQNAVVDWANERAYILGNTSDNYDTIWTCDTTDGTGTLLATTDVATMCGISGNQLAIAEGSCLGGDGFLYFLTGTTAIDTYDYSTLALSKVDPATMAEVARTVLSAAAVYANLPDFRIVPFTANGINYIGTLVDLYAMAGHPNGVFQVFRCSTMASQATQAFTSTGDNNWIVAGNSPTATTTRIYRGHNNATNDHYVLSAFVFDTTGPSLSEITVADHPSTDFDPSWTFIDAGGNFYYDVLDHNVIISTERQSRGPTDPAYLVKINTATGAIIWQTPVSVISFGNSTAACFSDLSGGKLILPADNSLYPHPTNGSYYSIDTATGVATTHISGFFADYDGNDNGAAIAPDGRVLFSSTQPAWFGWSVWKENCAAPVVEVAITGVSAGAEFGVVSEMETNAFAAVGVYALAIAGQVEIEIPPFIPPPPPQGWVIDLFDDQDNPIITGIPLVTGANLLAQYDYLNFGGQLVVQTDHDVDRIPAFSNIGEESHLYFSVVDADGMRDVFEIPTSAKPQSFSIDLGGAGYTVNLYWADTK